MKKADLLAAFFWLTVSLYGLFAAIVLSGGWAKGENNVWMFLVYLGGAIVAFVGAMLAFVKYGEWYEHRNKVRLHLIVSAEIGRPVTDLRADEGAEEVLKVLVKRYSRDRFCNRASDAVGTINKIVDAVGVLGSGGLGLVSLYFLFSEGVGSEHCLGMAWCSVGVMVLFNLIQTCNETLCDFIFGRWPGEARLANLNIIPNLIKSRRHNS
jgi:hypothetical protein